MTSTDSLPVAFPSSAGRITIIISDDGWAPEWPEDQRKLNGLPTAEREEIEAAAALSVSMRRAI
jgi:hypothetical protein